MSQGHVIATLELPEWLTAPDGRRVDDVPASEFRRQVLALGLENVPPSLGHTGLVEAYADHLRGVYDRAGRRAVTGYLAAMGVMA